jgi:hypothetical protein
MVVAPTMRVVGGDKQRLAEHLAISKQHGEDVEGQPSAIPDVDRQADPAEHIAYG